MRRDGHGSRDRRDAQTMIPHVSPVPPVSCVSRGYCAEMVFPQPARLRAIGSDHVPVDWVRPTITAEGGDDGLCVVAAWHCGGAE